MKKYQTARSQSQKILFVTCFALAVAGFANVSTAEHSEIASGFNGTQIQAGSWVWFNSNFKYSGPKNVPVSILVDNAFIDIYDGNVLLYSLPVPDGVITMSPIAAMPSIAFNGIQNRWEMTIPSSFGDDIFIAGLAWQVPVDLPGGLDVVWRADFTSSVVPVQLKWKWSAAIYTDFTDDYAALDVKPIHQTLHAGTPQAYENDVIGGGRGGGGSNFTGSWSGTATVSVGETLAVESRTWSAIKNTFR